MNREGGILIVSSTPTNDYRLETSRSSPPSTRLIDHHLLSTVLDPGRAGIMILVDAILSPVCEDDLLRADGAVQLV